jgi:hypothetical protein
MNLDEVSVENLPKLSDKNFKDLLSKFISLQAEDLKENAILYYRPVSSVSEKVHLSKAKTIGIGGGNRSSKTETCLAEIVMCCTGITPLSLVDKIDPREKFLGPINVRIVCESITTVLHTIMLPKFQYWKWNGPTPQGGPRGHWGWIPKTSLIDGSWDKSWSEKNRLLRILYRDPEDFDRIMGESTIQFMSHDQDPSDFSSGDFNIVLHDEPPKYATWRENEARLMGVAGRNFLAMTWPDDPAISVDWIFDEVYEKAQPGAHKDPDVDWFELVSTDNLNVDQEAIAKKAASWSSQVRKTRIYGQPIRFSNRIHSQFTDYSQVWCFKCGDSVTPKNEECPVCGSNNLVTYNHVKDFEPHPSWPTVFLLDPHPRKPHMFMWVQVDAFDDLWVVAYDKVEDVPVEVKKRVDKIETSLKLRVFQRLIDPNMGSSPSGIRREVSWADEFANAGLRCDLADDSDVGRARLNDYLKPDPKRLAPRIHFREGLYDPVLQMKRYSWDDHRASLEKDLKQKPKEKYDDFPTLLKYLMNTDPSFSFLVRGAPVLHRVRKGAYG